MMGHPAVVVAVEIGLAVVLLVAVWVRSRDLFGPLDDWRERSQAHVRTIAAVRPYDQDDPDAAA